MRDYSMEAARRFADESLDFVYIDANHDYRHVREDITEWSKKVRKGGIISGHDYLNSLDGVDYGVKKAVDKWVKVNKIRYLFILNKQDKNIKVISPSWMFVKK